MTLTRCDVCDHMSSIATSQSVTLPIMALCVPGAASGQSAMLCDQYQAQDAAMETLIRYLDLPEWVVITDNGIGKGKETSSFRCIVEG